MIKRGNSKIDSVKKISFWKIAGWTVNSLILFYLAFSLFSLTACSKKNEGFDYEQQENFRSHTIKTLEEKFDAKLLTGGINKVMNMNVVLDSTVLGIEKVNDEYFIKARVNVNSDKKYFANLKCSQEILDAFNKTKSNYVIMAARILQVLDYNITADSDSLSGGKSSLNLGNAVLLTGECLALADVPAIINAN